MQRESKEKQARIRININFQQTNATVIYLFPEAKGFAMLFEKAGPQLSAVGFLKPIRTMTWEARRAGGWYPGE